MAKDKQTRPDEPERFPRSEFPPTTLPPADAAAPKPPKKTRRGGLWANLLTTVLVLLTLAAAAGFVLAVRNPYHPLNPLALPTPLPQIITATFLPPTETPPPSDTPTATVPPVTPGQEPTLGLATGATPAGSPTPLGGGAGQAGSGLAPFVQDGDVTYTENQNERGCNWASIAGTVFNLESTPVSGLGVRITDVESEEPITVFTGSSSRYPDGFEYVFNNAPVSRGFMVEVVTTGGDVLSEPVMVVTSERCSQNVLVINFEQVSGY